ncbi:hypothetical protein VZT92_010498 [Zoarces viviparus]|uniref:Uncharacterized protein n=1 Tax=Zoarces viviparus TaxID=48416 RepID=A0AAW1F8K7_ZOAVI
MGEAGDRPHNGIDNSRYRRNDVNFIDLRNPPTAAGDRNYVGIQDVADLVANGRMDEANQYDFNNDNMNNIVNIDNNDGINNDNVDDNAYNIDINDEYAEVAGPYRECEEIRWWDEFAESDTDSDEETETSPIENAKVPEDDPLPGPSKKRERNTNRVEEERSSKKSRLWDESAESDTDSDEETETSPIEHATVPEDDPLPGSSKKQKRETDRVEDDRSSKKSRQWDESAESSTDFNKETETSPLEHAKVPEDDPLPGPSKKRKRKTNRVEDDRSSRLWDMSLLKAALTCNTGI